MDSNESGESIVSFTIIIMNHNNKLPPLKKILDIEVQERWKFFFCYYYDEKYESSYKYKMRQNFLSNGHKSEGKATCEAKNDIKMMILWF